MNTIGEKHDLTKPRMGLVLTDFRHALLQVGHVGTFGAYKYADHGWLTVPDGHERYTNALYRHLLTAPYEIDDESGLPHAAHAAWNALARLELELRDHSVA